MPIYPAPARTLADGLDAGGTLLALLGSANLASRRWAFEQYDCIVGSRTVKRPEAADAAVLMLEHGGAIAVSIDGNGRRVAVDPYRGAVEAVLECSANLACTGAEPLGLTNCLNFGNPEKPHIAWQLTRAVAGLGDACRALGVPVVGGNVSLYNEGGGGPIYPTPVVGMVGELPDPARSGRLGFAAEGDAIALIAAGWAPAAAGSELAKLRGEPIAGELPHADLGELRALHAAVRQGVRSGALRSAHDVAEGGLAVALAESCLGGGIGARIDFGAPADEALLFGEGPGAFVVSGPAEALARFGGAARVIGTVGGELAADRGRPRRAARRALPRARGRPRRPAALAPRAARDPGSRRPGARTPAGRCAARRRARPPGGSTARRRRRRGAASPR